VFCMVKLLATVSGVCKTNNEKRAVELVRGKLRIGGLFLCWLCSVRALRKMPVGNHLLARSVLRVTSSNQFVRSLLGEVNLYSPVLGFFFSLRSQLGLGFRIGTLPTTSLLFLPLFCIVPVVYVSDSFSLLRSFAGPFPSEPFFVCGCNTRLRSGINLALS